MSLVRINYFQAVEGKETAVLALLRTVQNYIENSPGNIACQLLRSSQDKAQFVVIEHWQSKKAHQQSLQKFPNDQMADAMQLFAKPPHGEDYLA